MLKNTTNKKLYRIWITGVDSRNAWRKFLRDESKNLGVKLTSDDGYLLYWSLFEEEMDESNETRILEKNFKDLKEGSRSSLAVKFTEGLVDTILSGISKLGKDVLLKYGTKFYTVNDKNIAKLSRLIAGIELAQTKSDGEILEYINNGEDVIIIKKEEMMEGFKFIDTDDEDDNAPGGSWFSHYLNDDVPIDLKRYDIYKKGQKENHKENCLLKALIAFGIPKKQLEFCKEFFKNREIPQIELRKIGVKLKLNFHITIVCKKTGNLRTTKGKIIDKTFKTCHLGRINNHWFINETIETKISQWSLKNWNEAKKFKNPYEIKFKTGVRGNFINNSAVLINLLWRHKETFLTEKTINETILKSQYYDKVDNFETLVYDPELNTKSNTNKRLFKFEKFEPTEPKATFILDFETISAQTLPKKGDLGIRVFNRLNANEPVREHKPYALGWGQYGEALGVDDGYYWRIHMNYGGDKIDKDLLLNTSQTTKECIKKMGDSYKNFHRVLSDIAQLAFPKGDADISRKSKDVIRLIFHNAGYDSRFIKPLLSNWTSLEKGSKLISGKGVLRYFTDGKYAKVIVEIRDSYGLIPVSLGSFSKIFPTLEQEKELLPYSYYTYDNCEGKEPFRLDIKDLDKYDELKTSENKEIFLANAKRWNCLQNGKVNMLQYSGEYCKLDVKVLNDGLIEFCKAIEIISADNPFEYAPLQATDSYTLPSLIFDILLMKGCFDDTYTISGVPQQFIQRCVVGGRCMLKDNEKQYFKQHTKDGVVRSVQDYDSVSCYTSAFVRMKGLLKGIPKPIKGSKYEHLFNTTRRNNKLLNERLDAYYLQIKITKVGKPRHFPVVSATVEGIRHWGNDLVGETIYCDNVSLDDFIEFQDVEFIIEDGYYFNDGFNPTIVEVMRDLFQKRIVAKNNICVYKKGVKEPIKIVELDPKTEGLANKAKQLVKDKIVELKKEYGEGYTFEKYKNPIEQVYKLLLNSCYGKMLLKEIETDTEYLPKVAKRKTSEVKLKKLGLPLDSVIYEDYSPAKKAILRHYNKIRELEDLGDEVRITYWKSINDHHNNVHQGVQVLSYAKQLMNEVICLAEDNDIEILYTDTDSIHIVDVDIPKLEQKFKEKYGRELRGEDLNQFNEDFDSNLAGVKSTTFIGIAKKCYIDELKGINTKTGKEETEYHIRLKGCPNPSILREVDRRGITPLELYELLYDDTRISFDLLKKADNTIKCRFKFNKNWTITNETNFNRSLCFNKEKKDFIQDLIGGKKKVWGTDIEFSEWTNYNRTMLNLMSEVSSL